MNDDIKQLDKQNGEKLKKIYQQRLRNIKELLLKAVINGQDTSFLMKLEEKLEKQIRLLNKELQKTTEKIIDDGENKAFSNQKENLNYLLLSTAAIKKDKSPNTALKKNTNHRIRLITNDINNKVKRFINSDFNSTNKVIKNFERLTDIKIPPSRINKKYWQSLQAIIERDLKKKDIFKIAYKNKEGKIVRQVNVETYAEMLARTISAESYRQEIKNIVLKQFEDIGDLVEVVGAADCQCDVCAKYYGQILSLTGKTKGYITVDEAKEEGLFHPNCRHYFTITEKVLNIYKKTE